MRRVFRVSNAKKLLSLLLCMLFVFALAACGGKEDSSIPEPEPLPSIMDETPEEEPVEEEFDPLEVAFLTGLEKGADYPEGQRFVAVMVNNIASSRPTRGLSDAQMLFEIKVEGGITRFMALFEDYKTMPEVGSIRSARDQFIQLIAPFQPFYIHDGPGNATHPANIMLDNYELWDFDLQWGKYSGLAWRDQARVAAGMNSEYTEYTDGEHVTDVIESNNLDAKRQYNSPIFSFVPYDEEPRTLSGGTATEVGIVHSASYRTSFNYSDGKYLMSQYSSSSGGVNATVDENNGQQVAFDNVLVLFAPMRLYDASELVKVEYYTGGGYYISNGTWEPLLWEKGGPDTPLKLMNIDKSEETVHLNPGKTYVAIVDDTLAEDFDASLRANSADAVSEGEVNSNEDDFDEE